MHINIKKNYKSTEDEKGLKAVFIVWRQLAAVLLWSKLAVSVKNMLIHYYDYF